MYLLRHNWFTYDYRDPVYRQHSNHLLEIVRAKFSSLRGQSVCGHEYRLTVPKELGYLREEALQAWIKEELYWMVEVGILVEPPPSFRRQYGCNSGGELRSTPMFERRSLGTIGLDEL